MVTCVVFKAWSPGAVSVPRPGGRRFKSNPRHQGKDKGSIIAPLQFFWITTLGYWFRNGRVNSYDCQLRKG